MLQTPPDWVLRLRAAADQPPLRERVPLRWGGIEIGHAEHAVLQQIERAFSYQRPTVLRHEAAGWHIDGNLTESLARIALTMRELNLADRWRNEQLPVIDSGEQVLGTVERAAVYPLGFRTRGVHLVGETSDGQFWVQQRSLTKANDPGQWDTLMGGMISAVDTLEGALVRETWEEAGLRLHDLFGLTFGGVVQVHRPTTDGVGSYISERIDWYRATIPANCVPINQDGEVARFAKVPRKSMVAGISAGKFTLEAGLVTAAALGF
ncbi:MAG: NUDIX domain-containing protein [Rhizobacter sp.]|nr:NUDIX domain-containing protein [Burkholderiales bacterium]